jgi:hypothetical protein
MFFLYLECRALTALEENDLPYCAYRSRGKGGVAHSLHFRLGRLFSRAGHALFLRFALALSRSLAELFALALSRSFLGLKFRAFAFALLRSRAP